MAFHLKLVKLSPNSCIALFLRFILHKAEVSLVLDVIHLENCILKSIALAMRYNSR